MHITVALSYTSSHEELDACRVWELAESSEPLCIPMLSKYHVIDTCAITIVQVAVSLLLLLVLTEVTNAQWSLLSLCVTAFALWVSAAHNLSMWSFLLFCKYTGLKYPVMFDSVYLVLSSDFLLFQAKMSQSEQNCLNTRLTKYQL